MPGETLSPHQPGHDCPACRELDRAILLPQGGGTESLRDLIFQAIYAELSGSSILHYLIKRHDELRGTDVSAEAYAGQAEGAGAEHARIECSCGVLIAQCRCFGAHKQKVNVRPRGCVACQSLKG